MQIAGQHRLPHRFDRRVPGKALAPCDHHAPGRHRRRERPVAQHAVLAILGIHVRHRRLRQHRDADAGRHHVADGFQRRTFKGARDAVAGGRVARHLRADFQHLVAEAMAVAEQQHGFRLQLLMPDLAARGPRMLARHRHHERFVVQRLQHQALIRHRQRDDRRIQLALAQHFHQPQREIFLQDQGHLRHPIDHGLDQRRQQVRADGVDDAEPQWTRQRVLVLAGDLLDGRGLLQYPFGLVHDLHAKRRHRNLGPAALENRHAQLVFELLDRHRQRRLRDVAGFRGMAKMLVPRDGDDVFEFSQSHDCIFAQRGWLGVTGMALRQPSAAWLAGSANANTGFEPIRCLPQRSRSRKYTAGCILLWSIKSGGRC